MQAESARKRRRAPIAILGALAIDPEGVDFAAVGGGPVHVIFLILAPTEGRNQYFDVLGKIAAVARDKSLLLRLRGCRTPGEAHAFLQELDRD